MSKKQEVIFDMHFCLPPNSNFPPPTSYLLPPTSHLLSPISHLPSPISHLSTSFLMYSLSLALIQILGYNGYCVHITTNLFPAFYKVDTQMNVIRKIFVTHNGQFILVNNCLEITV
jgi:uncharacterized protein YggT (Ycf19 family)